MHRKNTLLHYTTLCYSFLLLVPLLLNGCMATAQEAPQTNPAIAPTQVVTAASQTNSTPSVQKTPPDVVPPAPSNPTPSPCDGTAEIHVQTIADAGISSTAGHVKFLAYYYGSHDHNISITLVEYKINWAGSQGPLTNYYNFVDKGPISGHFHAGWSSGYIKGESNNNKPTVVLTEGYGAGTTPNQNFGKDGNNVGTYKSVDNTIMFTGLHTKWEWELDVAALTITPGAAPRYTFALEAVVHQSDGTTCSAKATQQSGTYTDQY